jgi:hypothetical protein
MTPRRRRTRQRTVALIGGAVAAAAAAVAIAVTRPPAYSGFEAIGKQPAIVQVFLPG